MENLSTSECVLWREALIKKKRLHLYSTNLDLRVRFEVTARNNSARFQGRFHSTVHRMIDHDEIRKIIRQGNWARS